MAARYFSSPCMYLPAPIGIWPCSIAPASTAACLITRCRIANLQFSAMGSVALNESGRGVRLGAVRMTSRNERRIVGLWVELVDGDSNVGRRSSRLSSFVCPPRAGGDADRLRVAGPGGARCWCGGQRATFCCVETSSPVLGRFLPPWCLLPYDPKYAMAARYFSSVSMVWRTEGSCVGTSSPALGRFLPPWCPLP